MRISLTGSGGTGKCVKGDTCVFVNNILTDISSITKNKGYFNYYCNVLNNNGVNDTTSHFYTEDVNKVITITNSMGISLTGTYNHPVYCFDSDLNNRYVSLKDIVIGDIVCIPRGYNTFPVDESNISFNKTNNTNTKDIYINETFTKEYSELLGYLVANGNFDVNSLTFTSSNDLLVSRFKKIINSFGIDVQQNDISYRVSSILLRRFVEYCNGSLLTTARYKTVPIKVLSSPKEHQRIFLRSLFDCDGYFNKDKQYFEYSTASKDLCYKVFMMLLNFDVLSTRKDVNTKDYDHTYNSLIITSNDLDVLFKDILFDSFKYDYVECKRNTNKNVIPYLKEYIINTKKSLNVKKNGVYNIDGVSYKWPYMKIHDRKAITYDNLADIVDKIKDIDHLSELYNKLIDIQNNNYYYTHITNKDYIETNMTVYDFTIPLSKNFISNGYISHNTTLLGKLNKELNFHVIDENIRPWLEKNGFTNFKQMTIDDLCDMQTEVMYGKIKEEKIFDSFISDRTTIDNAMYTLRWISSISNKYDNWFQQYLIDARYHAKKYYDIIFVLPYGKFEIDDDGIRSGKKWYQFLMQELIEKEIFDLQDGDCWPYIHTVESIDLDQRVNECINIYNKVVLSKRYLV